MAPDHLTRLDDLTRRYARYRPCGAGLGVVWGGLLLGLLGGLMLRWLLGAFRGSGRAAEGLWHFSRTSNVAAPGWLGWAALMTPILGWVGLVIIQRSVDGFYGAVESADRPAFPRWLAAKAVASLAGLLFLLQAWEAPAALLGRGPLGILAITAWSLVWGRGLRDRLTHLVMLWLSIPPIFLLATLIPDSRLASANLSIFGFYLVLMLVLVVQGARRFFAFLKVSAELETLPAAAE